MGATLPVAAAIGLTVGLLVNITTTIPATPPASESPSPSSWAPSFKSPPDAPPPAVLDSPSPSISPPASSPAPVPPSSSGPASLPGWTFLWGDEFEGESLDTSKWSYDLGRGDWGWGNNELQSYTSDPSNVRLEDGSLLITAVKAPDGSYTSGRINTKASASFMPGMDWGGSQLGTIRVEGRIRIPQPPAQGLWSAFWLFPKDLKYGVWPASGEIDIAESINAMTELTQCIHYGGPGPEWVQWPEQARQPNNAPWSDTYHTYAVDWSADTLQFSIDGKESFTVHSAASQNGGKGWYSTGLGAGPNSPFDHPFFIILNLAVGGKFPKDPDASTMFPATMAVDYVRVYGK